MSVFRIINANFYQMIVKHPSGGVKSMSLWVGWGGVSQSFGNQNCQQDTPFSKCSQNENVTTNLMTLVTWHYFTQGDQKAL